MALEYQQIDLTADQDYKGIRHYTRLYRVTSDTPVADPTLVYAIIPIVRGDAFPYDSLARCKKVSTRQDGDNNGLSWIVSYDYDNEQTDLATIDDDGSAPSGDPMDGSQEIRPDLRPPTFTLGTEEYQVIMPKDPQSGEVISASNFQPFDPPLMRTLVRSSITIEKFKPIASDNLGNKLTYENHVNNGAWWGIPDQCALCKSYGLTTVYEHGAFWWKKTVTLVLDKDEWRVSPLDCGTYEKNSDPDHPWQPILDQTGQPITSPVPLNGAGRHLPSGDPFVYQGPYAQYEKVSFASLI